MEPIMRTLTWTAGLLLVLCARWGEAAIASKAEDVQPLLVGSPVPSVEVTTVEGAAVDLRAAINGKPTLLVFYRGGWCPYCSLQLSELRKLEPDLVRQGVQVIAISPDRPAALRETLDGSRLNYTLLSDSAARAIQAFGIAFKVPDAEIEQYLGFGVDLEKASGSKHHALPVPGVFLVDKAGLIQFSYVNPDYRTRVPQRLVRAAVDAMLAGETGKPLPVE
jgi:peroxiredoxin